MEQNNHQKNQQSYGSSSALPSSEIETPRQVLHNGFRYQKLLSEGGYGKIFQAIQLSTGRLVAIKQFDRLRNDPHFYQWHQKGLMNWEMKIMKSVKHCNLMNAIEVHKYRRLAFIVMPLMAKGSVYNVMSQQQGPFTESQSQIWFYDLSNGIHYLHNNNIVHRDLKLENFLIDDRNHLVITDFGFAKYIPFETILNNDSLFINDNSLVCYTPCGTVEYSAPEINILKKMYFDPKTDFDKLEWIGYDGRSADIYALGACLFELVCFEKAFLFASEYKLTEPNRIQTVYPRQILREFTFDPRKYVSLLCFHLILSLLSPNPLERPKIEQLLNCDWLANVTKQ